MAMTYESIFMGETRRHETVLEMIADLGEAFDNSRHDDGSLRTESSLGLWVVMDEKRYAYEVSALRAAYQRIVKYINT